MSQENEDVVVPGNFEPGEGPPPSRKSSTPSLVPQVDPLKGNLSAIRAQLARLEAREREEATLSNATDEDKADASKLHDIACAAPNHVGGGCEFELEKDWNGKSRKHWLQAARRIGREWKPKE